MVDDRKASWARAASALASLKLALFLFFALAGTSAFGTVIEQQADPDPEAYPQSFGPVDARLLQALGMTDLYRSWWFEVL
ncbi:MAG: cytochrome c biogenesis protein ResB [Deltaproteobacteria bacterium]|nr:cytochrome c biogenesis protein ResB [Deltaproteobacteria bacterium]